jgi:hypothetical protein
MPFVLNLAPIRCVTRDKPLSSPYLLTEISSLWRLVFFQFVYLSLTSKKKKKKKKKKKIVFLEGKKKK